MASIECVINGVSQGPADAPRKPLTDERIAEYERYLSDFDALSHAQQDDTAPFGFRAQMKELLADAKQLRRDFSGQMASKDFWRDNAYSERFKGTELKEYFREVIAELWSYLPRDYREEYERELHRLQAEGKGREYNWLMLTGIAIFNERQRSWEAEKQFMED